MRSVMNMEMGRKFQKKPGKFLFSSGTEFQEIPASECHCDTCGQTDRYNETNIGLSNFIRNVHNEKWIKERETECRVGQQTDIIVQQYN